MEFIQDHMAPFKPMPWFLGEFGRAFVNGVFMNPITAMAENNI